MAYFGSWQSPGAITMNFSAYQGADLEMLIADLFHESAHSLLSEEDGATYPYDPWNRSNLNSVSYDDLYRNNQCPIPVDPQ